MDTTQTPCIGICSTVFGDDICRGCKRYSQEIIRWNQFGAPAKDIVWRRLEKLQKQVIKEKIHIQDFALFQHQLTRYQIKHNPQLDPLCWVFNLLEQKKSVLKHTRELGLQIRPPYQHLSLEQLFETLDSALYELSVAHFDLSQARHWGNIKKSTLEKTSS
ncbi:MAG: DUF1289 domain-containing protein [Moraxellaceae bacterium]|nr:MAG: DUF1289 domain-containing protein [Moraxellaceae bacterium]